MVLSINNINKINVGFFDLLKNKHYLLLLVFYLIAQGGLLSISNSIYWDDWVLYRSANEVIISRFTDQAGTLFYLEGPIHIGLLSLGPWAYKILTLIFYFVAGIALDLVLKRLLLFSENTRFIIVLFFLILPLNSARVALVDLRYAACYSIFFVAWALMYRYRKTSLFLFFLSFNTNSLLVFYALPFLELFISDYRFKRNFNFLKFVNNNIYYIILPFLYFIIKITLFKPRGLYEGYNENFKLSNLLYLPVFQMYDFIQTNISLGLILILTSISFYLLKDRLNMEIDAGKDKFNPKILFLVGIGVFILGAFPYWIIGLLPSFADWGSRHQLLLPLGLSIVFTSCLFIDKNKLSKLSLSIIVGISLSLNIDNYVGFFRDWQKQTQIIDFLSRNQTITESQLIAIRDQSEEINAVGRQYRFYEWNGLMEFAQNNQKHFVIRPDDLDEYRNGKFEKYMSKMYKAGEFNNSIPNTLPLLTISIVEPKHFIDKVEDRFFPKLNFNISLIDIRNNQKF